MRDLSLKQHCLLLQSDRTMAEGSKGQKVLIAVDGSEHASYAVKCKYIDLYRSIFNLDLDIEMHLYDQIRPRFGRQSRQL